VILVQERRFIYEITKPVFPRFHEMYSWLKRVFPRFDKFLDWSEIIRYWSPSFICRSLNGSFIQPSQLPDGSPSPKKLHEHAENVRRAVEQHHNKSIEESDEQTPRSTSGFSGKTPLYLME